ncbi:MAG: hypothetical protein IM631_10295 [Cytophagales bacterium]|jgi:hypothetical protein|nr:hypothetical protein [Cytophagales bacterium]MCA6371782.1 hypothetical protein [Cytophagales bacterium]MCA6378005.1 hypothetical protein [Cytophagales bacterium]MCA6386206.1 hypothetical protein [Cytophagales bacterium]
MLEENYKEVKAFKVVFRHGHFIDVATNKRIIPVQGKEFNITANENAFTTEDEKLKIKPPCYCWSPTNNLK